MRRPPQISILPIVPKDQLVNECIGRAHYVPLLASSNPPSILRINRIMGKTNGKRGVYDGFKDKRRHLVAEIMTLSPPASGCQQRARLILESKFSLNELQVLAEALRDGAAVKLET